MKSIYEKSLTLGLGNRRAARGGVAFSECTIWTEMMFLSTIYYGLFALQHCGRQESCGIAVSDTYGPKGVVTPVRVNSCNEVFTSEKLEKLKGNIGVGHVRYSTAGSSTIENTQPLVLNYVKGTLALAQRKPCQCAGASRRELFTTERFSRPRSTLRSSPTTSRESAVRWEPLRKPWQTL